MTDTDHRRDGRMNPRGLALRLFLLLSTTCLLPAFSAAPALATGPGYPGETLSLAQNGPSVAGNETNFLASGQQTDVNNFAGGFGLEVYTKDPRVDPTCAPDYMSENNASLNDPSERWAIIGQWLGSSTTFSQPFKIVFSSPGPVLLCAYTVWVTDTAAAAQLSINVSAAGTNKPPAHKPSLAQRAKSACRTELRNKGKARFDAKYGSKHPMQACTARWIRRRSPKHG